MGDEGTRTDGGPGLRGSGAFRIRRTAVAAVLGLLAGAAAAGGTAAALWPDDAKSPPPYTYPDDAVVDSAPLHSGFLEVRVTAFRCGMTFITGTHAEHVASGQICRIGVRLDNQQAVTANIDSRLQVLVLDDGTEVPIDDVSMMVKRQQQVQQMGARNIVVLSYWFDIPADRHPAAIRVRATVELPPAEVPLPRRTWDR